MKAKYVRVSTANQNLERQLLNEDEFKIVYVDVCSGGVPFKERKQASKLLKNKDITHITISELLPSLSILIGMIDVIKNQIQSDQL